jgi:D-glycero-D-manno-heptose 1,7-bisphosphate phosphatase
MSTSIKAKAVFIDRDGVINEERNYVHRISDFVLLPGVVEGLTLLRNAGYRLIVVTNQAGIARGYYAQDEMDRLHDHMRELLAKHGVSLDAIYFCPHHPQGSIEHLSIECNCRKPSPGMVVQASRDFDLNLATSVLIGDKLSDVQAGKRAGVGRTVLVESGHPLEPEDRLEANVVAADLHAAARMLVNS